MMATGCQHCGAPMTRQHICLGMLEGLPVGPRVGRRVVILSDDLKARAREVVAFAEANPYRPGVTRVPGTMPEHELLVPVGVRCVFSITEMPDGLPYRHLSVSLADAPTNLPAPEIVIPLAIELFGFTMSTPEQRWSFGLPETSSDPMVAVVAQPLRPEALA